MRPIVITATGPARAGSDQSRAPVPVVSSTGGQVCALVAAGVGLAALTGWETGWPVLATYSEASIPMAPSSALAFLVLGSAVFGLARWTASRLGRRFATSATLLVSLAALLVFAESVAGVDLGLEQMLVRTSKTFMGFPQGRMSPVTAASFLLASLAALLLSTSSARRWPAHDLAAVLAIVVIAVASMVTLGYLFGAPLLYGGPTIPMALPTGLAFVTLGAAILALAGPYARVLSPWHGPTVRARLLRVFLPTVAAVILLEGFFEHILAECWSVNPALRSALAAIASMAVMVSVIAFVAAGIGGAIDRAEVAQRRAEIAAHKLSRAVEQSPAIVMITNRLGAIEYVNPKFTRLTGYTTEEVLGQNPRILKSGFTPPETYEQLWATITVGGEWRGEFVNKKKDGDLYWESASISPIFDAEGRITHFVAVKEDITDRKRAEEALRASEALNRGILEAAVDGIVTTDEQGIVHSFNPAAERLFGYAAEEVLGQTVTMLIPPAYRDAHKAGLARFLVTGESKVLGTLTEVAGLRKDGTVFPMHLSVGELRWDTQRRFVGVAHDLTDRKRAEKVREALIAQLEEKNAEMERFTYTVSHDLKSPLVTISGFLGFLEKDARKGDLDAVRGHAARVAGAADHMKCLVDELLELSRVGRVAARREAVSMAALAQEAVQINAGRIAARHVQVEIAPDLSEVYGDRQRLLQVWENLVGNAVKFMGDQPAPRVDLGLRHEGAEPVYFVRDNGAGIDPQFAQSAFEVFRKLDPKAEGSGIGLAIVKRIVELHGGRIWVESEGPGKGATFCFTLPEANHAPD
ncbi:MAG: PAS domain S-box protein [Pirellulales bacterium]